MLVGTNYHPIHGYRPKDVADTNAQLCRFPMWDYYDKFIKGIEQLGIEPLPVLDKNALHRTKKDWLWHMERYAARYPTIKYWQIGNESDQPNSESSWYLPPETFTTLLEQARQAFPDKYLIAGGLVSGDPTYLNRVDLSLVDAIAVHPYGQAPDSWMPWGHGYASTLLASYRRFNKSIWVTEFGGQSELFHNEHERAVYHTEMIRTLANFGVKVAVQFCLTDKMVPGFGMIDTDGNPKETYAAFKDSIPIE